MQTTTIDSIVRSTLASVQLPVHYYLLFLHFGLKGLNELNFDVMGNVKTVRLYTDDTHRIALPEDYLAWIKVGIEKDQYVQVMTANDSLNSLHNYDSNGAEIPYPKNKPSLKGEGAYYFGNYINEYGEMLGGFYGFGDSAPSTQFKEIPESGEIQLDSSFGDNEKIYLEYLAHQSASAASLIHPYMADVIENYILWKYKKNSRLYGLGEARDAEKDYNTSHRLLRARKNKLNKDKILKIIRKNMKQTVKL